MITVGINFGHNSSVAVLRDGEIVFAQSEERMDRIKNSYGFPYKTLLYVLEKFGTPDLVVINWERPFVFNTFKEHNFQNFRYIDDFYTSRSLNFKNFLKYFLFKTQRKLFIQLYNIVHKCHLKKINRPYIRDAFKKYISNTFNFNEEKIVFLNHHLAHAYSVCFNLNPTKKTLIFTLDESGDGLCATISIFSEGELSIISKISEEHSIGILWHNMTGFMGLKPLEDEYKIMGLAPYAKTSRSRIIADKLHQIIKLNNKGEFEALFPTLWFYLFMWEKFIYERFDNLAGGIQLFTEKIVCDWITYWVNKTGIRNIALSGGVFMNVKLNKKIMELPQVESLFIMPSAGDESASFGCTYYGYKKFCIENNIEFKPQPFTHLYLGLSFNNEEISKFIKENKLGEKFKIEFFENIEKIIAELLAKNEIVARFAGRMEFGARALGNRSILAHPSNPDNVRIINEMIKNRDFWMPFAPSILEEDQNKYITNTNKAAAFYMILAFDTTKEGREKLKAAIHPYDFTVRPQIVNKKLNPEYHYLISEFKKLTGIGAILNTSFNLHGEPLVCSPQDAISTFERSGLKYLALGNYLISKK